MSRIRSVHPGLFTDESFASVSMAARLLMIGLWTEAWDDGVFEWKPVTLKMRIFPADNIDVVPLLDELLAAGVIRCFDNQSKLFGVIKNFCKYQRPKKPNSSGVLPDQFRTYVCYGYNSSEPVPNQYGTSSEPVPNQYGTSSEPVPKSPVRGRMEDGGWIGISPTDSSADAAADQPPAKIKRTVDPSKTELMVSVGEQWNDMAATIGLPAIQTIDGGRERAFFARARDLATNYEFTDPHIGFTELFAKVRASPFLRGEGRPRNGAPPFRATFDWVLKAENFRKIMEDNYGR